MPPLSLQRGLLALLILLIGLNLHAQEPARDDDEPLPPGAIARLGTTRLVHLGGLASVAVSPDGKIVASGVSEGNSVLDTITVDLGNATISTEVPVTQSNLRIWDAKTGKLIREITSPDAPVSALCLDADGKTVFAGCGRYLCAFEVATGKKLWQQTVKDEGRPSLVKNLALMPKQEIAAKLTDSSVYHWNSTTGKRIDPGDAGKQRFDAATNGTTIAEINGNTVRLVAADSGKSIHIVVGHRLTPLLRYSLHTKDTLVSSDGIQAFLWDSHTWKAKRSLPGLDVPHNNRFFRSQHSGMDFNISLERQICVRQSKDGLEIQDAENGQLVRRMEGSTPTRPCACFSASGNRLFYEFDDTVVFYDVATGKKLSKIGVNERHWKHNVAISAAGRFFGIGSFSETDIYEVNSGKLRSTLRGKDDETVTVQWFQFSDDEKSVIGESRGKNESEDGHRDVAVAVWDVGTGKLVRKITLWRYEGRFHLRSEMMNKIHAFALSRDARSIAVVPKNSPKVEIWEVASGTKRGELVGHAGAVADVAFSPDGRQLASSSEDTTILIWDLHRPLQSAKLKDRLTGDELAGHLKTLFQPDAAKADVAIWSLIHAAKDSVPFLKTRLRPAPRPDGKQVERLLNALDSGEFRIRSKAESELEGLGDLVLIDLKAALKQNNPVEKRRRLEGLLAKAYKAAEPFGTSERIGQWRMLEMLEKIGTPDATQVVRDIAGGAPGAQLTLAAQATLSRMEAIDKAKDSIER
jgi:WD40 repeat protein